MKKVVFDNIDETLVKSLEIPSYVNLMKVAIDYSDALIVGSEIIPDELSNYLKNSKKPLLDYKNKDEFGEAYTEFCKTHVLS